jgi:hypothetical protein
MDQPSGPQLSEIPKVRIPAIADSDSILMADTIPR